MSKNSVERNLPTLPVVANCEGCGVCCLHMGYPAFIMPSEPMTDAEIDANSELVARIEQDPLLRNDLRNGHPGEKHWHSLPDELRAEWQEFVSEYSLPEHGDEVAALDGPCLWFDLKTRECKNHEHRPQVCRDFETGSPECLEWRHYYRSKISAES